MSYRATIARQPDSLRDSIAAASADLAQIDVSPMSSGLIGVTGIGASFAAATVVAGEFQRIGKRAQAIRAVDLMQGGNFADSIIAMSAGGRSIEPVTAIKAHAECVSFGITKEGNNPLSAAVNAHIHFASGSDATPSSTGYTGTLVAAGLLADKVAGSPSVDWSALPDLAADVLKLAGARMDALAAIFKDRRAIDCVGAGSSFGTADGASLLIREAARIPAGPSDTLHYLHGPMEPMDATTGVVIIGDTREIKLAQDMAAIGSGVLLITAEDVPDAQNLVVIKVPAQSSRIARAILDILPAQLLAATLSDAAGLTDTKFRYRQTDTKIAAA
ncbi:glucosamine--fructose-6-phosphate aminotransferase [Xaviernesmea oryzae]|uniref:Glutamine--fructose-6-phosphate aminotransferase [isomerizing] n=1 Tax=Xaviernesmea oryzae TaxID=464029 RepID=A0A1Q9B0V0_9HYPH|nr:glucosamine--fructose-6-phosphate aminotransferase [Xaviernesmea oryzae]OLP61590.1 glucosamine--fructose-6-phosphate aminotransferase [Xaviernesmea oryzae]SEL07306.1 glucosamine--fructose-6-phosphate aminotransferase (isomerizing) [Xaviernesmea oryzae]